MKLLSHHEKDLGKPVQTLQSGLAAVLKNSIILKKSVFLKNSVFLKSSVLGSSQHSASISRKFLLRGYRTKTNLIDKNVTKNEKPGFSKERSFFAGKTKFFSKIGLFCRKTEFHRETQLL